ncbi:hypothetical protein [Streptomyces subrutilus]|uniref:Uncharacterized protein n=1 Tax=Streptomyces subrutilus TaxID=36818 RepID=A0A1E5NXE6_9ACTN|nr:hypothetical protein [Streptomyces subrutilus]OEJ20906.1 hypothetical protein BGK67_35315 [Streptomyces subrutilus]
MHAELDTKAFREIDGAALYLATYYEWSQGRPRLVTAAADNNAAYWTVRQADFGAEQTVHQSPDSELVRLVDAQDGAVLTTIIPVGDDLLDHHTPTLAEARTLPLARHWKANRLFTGHSISSPEAADRYELRDLLVRAARRGDTVATSPNLIIVRDIEQRQVAYIRDGWHPDTARPSVPTLQAMLNRRS